MNFMSENGVQSKRKDGEREKKIANEKWKLLLSFGGDGYQRGEREKTATTIKIEWYIAKRSMKYERKKMLFLYFITRMWQSNVTAIAYWNVVLNCCSLLIIWTGYMFTVFYAMFCSVCVFLKAKKEPERAHIYVIQYYLKSGVRIAITFWIVEFLPYLYIWKCFIFPGAQFLSLWLVLLFHTFRILFMRLICFVSVFFSSLVIPCFIIWIE